MKNQFKAIIVLALIIIAVGFLFYIAKSFGGEENAESENPLTICQPQNASPEQQNCYWTAHIHATIKITKSGGKVQIEFEQGELEEGHTHAEENKLHWHGLLSVDSQTKEVIDWSPLYVSKILDNLGILIEGYPKYILNGEEVNSDYIWQDGDVIEIQYG